MFICEGLDRMGATECAHCISFLLRVESGVRHNSQFPTEAYVLLSQCSFANAVIRVARFTELPAALPVPPPTFGRERLNRNNAIRANGGTVEEQQCYDAAFFE
ncbi:unnamed protein product, partial [Phaeothamnion confervicola]